MSIDLTQLSIAKVREHLMQGDFTVLDLAKKYQETIVKDNPAVNAYLEVYSNVMEEADRLQKLVEAKKDLPLLGVPIAIKDNILVEGQIASASSKMLQNFRAPYSATAIELLKNAGALFLGRTNMDEFAMGSSTETSAFGPTMNPLDHTRVPGGSSGGSAAAVAMRGALAALGSDTAGSVRLPASFCGCVGMYPTYGSISRHGLMSLGSSLDVIGPITTTVTDAQILYDVMKGRDPLDSTSVDHGTVSPLPTRKRVGVPRDFLSEPGIDADVLKNFETSLERMRNSGYEIVDINLPLAKYSLPVYYILLPAEASTNLARFDGIRYGYSASEDDLLTRYRTTREEGFGAEVKRRILLGTFVLSHGYHDAYYEKAIALRKKITLEYEAAFQNVDLIATPTAASVAFRLKEKQDPLTMYLTDLFTVPANIVCMPAISIPSGMNTEGLPYGFHLMAPRLREDWLFTAGKDFEATS